MHPAASTTSDTTTPITIEQLLFDDLTRPPAPAPLLPPAIAMMTGITIDAALHPPLLAYAVTTIAAIVFTASRNLRHGTTIAVVFTAFTFGAVLHDHQTRHRPSSHIAFHVGSERSIARITGTIITEPNTPQRDTGIFGRWTFRPPATRFLLDTHSIDTRQGPALVTGPISVSVNGQTHNITRGQRVTILGTISTYTPPANPGGFDYRQWQIRRGIHAHLRTNPANITIDPVQPAGMHRWIARWRNLTSQLLLGPDPTDLSHDQQLIQTMVLGRRTAVTSETEDLFRRTGLTHYLSVSGAHVGVVASFVWFLTRFTGRSRRNTAIIVLIALMSYAALVDPRPPIFRATIIGIVFCVGLILRRRSTGANTLALAAIILLTMRTTMLFEPGFQMSFAAVAGIIFLRSPIYGAFKRTLITHGLRIDRSTLPGNNPRARLRRVVHTLIATSVYGISAFLASAPVAGFHFDHIAPLGPIASLLVFPLFALTLFSGVLTILVGILIPIAAPLFQAITNTAASALLLETRLIDHVSPNITGIPAGIVRSLYFAIVLIAAANARIGSYSLWTHIKNRLPANPIRQRTIARVIVAGTFATCTAFPFVAHRTATPNALSITHLAVGAGTAAVIQFPDGTTWIYDCGTRRAYDLADRTVIPYLKHAGINRIDRLIISHPNLDHLNGVLNLVDNFPTGPVTINHHYEHHMAGDSPDRLLLAALQRRNHPVDKIEDIDLTTIPDTNIERLWPLADLPPTEPANESSTVLRITHANQSILIPGDIEQYAMDQLLNHHADQLTADVLVLPHHGSSEKNTARFIATVNPTVCIRSTHQRWDETGDQLLDAIAGRPVFSTADHGAVTVRLDPSGITATAHWADKRPPLHIPRAENPQDTSIKP